MKRQPGFSLLHNNISILNKCRQITASLNCIDRRQVSLCIHYTSAVSIINGSPVAHGGVESGPALLINDEADGRQKGGEDDQEEDQRHRDAPRPWRQHSQSETHLQTGQESRCFKHINVYKYRITITTAKPGKSMSHIQSTLVTCNSLEWSPGHAAIHIVKKYV